MKESIAIQAVGISSHFGDGLEDNINAILRGIPQSKRRPLNLFADDISSNYLSVKDRLAATNASDYLCSLLDTAIDELLTTQELDEQQRQSIPLFIGSSSFDVAIAEERYKEALDTNPNSAVPMPLDGFSHISDHLRFKYGFMGADFAFNTACTASANAMLCAYNGIQQGHYEQALVLGIESFNLTTASGFSAMQLLSQDTMHPFDQRRNGLVLGDGCAALLLSRDPNNNCAVQVSGGASQCDSHSISASNPDGSRITDLIYEALSNVQIKAEDIRAIKAHGTASPLNDVGEANAMHAVFSTLPPLFCLKPYIGHTLGACAAMEIALLFGLLKKGLLPVSGGFKYPDPDLNINANTETLAAEPGAYLANFFGFGGNNCSLILRFNDLNSDPTQ